MMRDKALNLNLTNCSTYLSHDVLPLGCSESMENVRRDHQMALGQVQRAKSQELEAALQSTDHARYGP